MMKTKMKMNQKGQLTVEFLFACVLIMGTAVLLGALTFALTLTEAVQYVSFAGARNYFAGEVGQQEQAQSATAKVQSLLKTLPFVSMAENNGWIKIIPKETSAGNFEASGYVGTLGAAPDSVPGRNQYVGYMITFELPLLKLRLPLFGDVLQPPDGESFKGRVTSFLMREPSTDECQKYNQQVYQSLIGINPAYGRVSNSPGVTVNPSSFLAINDNGC